MTKKLLTAAAFAIGIGLQAQVGINTATPRATLDVQPTAQALQNGENVGVVFPQLTSEQIRNISNPTLGTAVYNTTLKCLMVYNGNNITQGTDTLINWECEQLDRPLYFKGFRLYGGSDLDLGFHGIQTKDAGYIFVGITSSNDKDVSNVGAGAWAVKLNSVGEIVWQRTIPGGQFRKVIELANGELLLFGAVNRDKELDGLVLKLTADGRVLEKKTFGGSGRDAFFDAKKTLDGGFIAVGQASSIDGTLANIPAVGTQDYWIVKLNQSLDLTWQKRYGSPGSSLATAVVQTGDNGYAVTGVIDGEGGDVEEFHGNEDIWTIKLSADGVLQWQKTLGGSDIDGGATIFDFPAPYLVNSIDGGVIIGGSTMSSDGDISQNHGEIDVWIVKLNAAGQFQWEKTIGTEAYDFSFAAIRTPDDAYLITLTTGELDGTRKVVKVDDNGNIKWEKSVGHGFLLSVAPAANGNYFAVGGAPNIDGDFDASVLLFDQNGNEINP